jgi:hypothetical protein
MTNATAISSTSRSDPRFSRPTLDFQVRAWLRIEGLAMLIAAGIAYFQLGGSWVWFLPPLLAPYRSGLG